MNINYAKGPEHRVEEALAEGRMHLHFVLSLYALQLKEGRHSLHEHPETATSRRDP